MNYSHKKPVIKCYIEITTGTKDFFQVIRRTICSMNPSAQCQARINRLDPEKHEWVYFSIKLVLLEPQNTKELCFLIFQNQQLIQDQQDNRSINCFFKHAVR